MKKTLFLGIFAICATAFAAGNTYKVSLAQDSTVEGKTLKAGDYKVSVDNGNATFTRGKEQIVVPGRVETEANKNSNTEMTYSNNTELREIMIGGRNVKIVLDGSAAMPTGQ